MSFTYRMRTLTADEAKVIQSHVTLITWANDDRYRWSV